MRRRRKPEAPQEEGSPAWMNTYGDMVTLLLTFFVLLFSFSTIDAQKWEQIVSSLSGTPFVAIKAIDPGDTRGDIQVEELSQEPTPPPPEQVQQLEANIEEVKERFDELFEKIKKHIEDNDLGYQLNVEQQEDAILIRMADSALFDSGKDDIKEPAKEILLSLCIIIDEYTDLIRGIRIEGHTDTVPVTNPKFVDNWDLSTSRALQVLWFMLDSMEIDPAKMDPHGFGEYHPVDTNDTDEGKSRNRRVDFVLESILKE